MKIHMDIFSVKDFSATTLLSILKFDTKRYRDKLSCVTKTQPHIAYQSLYLFICSLSNENFCRRFLGSYGSQCFQILRTPSGRLSVLVSENKDAKTHFAFFSIFPSVTPI